MEKDLTKYVRINNGFLEAKECDWMVEEIKRLRWEKHTYTQGDSDERITYDDDLQVTYDNIEDNKVFMDKLRDALFGYVKDLDFPWFDGWVGFTVPRFNKYEPGTLMRNHCDHITSLFEGKRKGVPILTLLGMLNDDYEGGEFVMFDDEIIKLKKGDLVIFPSNFLYPHRVDPVTYGVRYSFVSWVW